LDIPQTRLNELGSESTVYATEASLIIRE
jgi:hypothetical protein